MALLLGLVPVNSRELENREKDAVDPTREDCVRRRHRGRCLVQWWWPAYRSLPDYRTAPVAPLSSEAEGVGFLPLTL